MKIKKLCKVCDVGACKKQQIYNFLKFLKRNEIMSYDLYFYKRKDQQLSEKEFCRYFENNYLIDAKEDASEWLYANDDTEVYFYICHNEVEEDPEYIEMYDNFSDFDNTYYTFTLNYLRPNFFGIEAFNFIEKFISDLDLFVLDPQSSDPDKPRKISANEMFAIWSKTNLFFSAEKFNDFDFIYLPIDKSDELWNYNYNRKILQEKLGDDYFVPKIYIMKTTSGNKAITVSTWTQHIPSVVPLADYYLLNKEYRKFFKNINESGLISYDSFIKNFSSFMDNFDFKDCKIIHPDKAKKAKDTFNSIKFEHYLVEFCERIYIDTLVNAKK